MQLSLDLHVFRSFYNDVMNIYEFFFCLCNFDRIDWKSIAGKVTLSHRGRKLLRMGRIWAVLRGEEQSCKVTNDDLSI